MTTSSITTASTFYPPLLRQIYDPPECLYYKGNPNLFRKTCISIVGTRKYSEYGEFVTEKLIEELAVLDIAIVSGLALGIDTIAHHAAMKFNLPTIAVLGTGINNIYPKANIQLAKKIISNHLLISEFEAERHPTKYSFPQRNRIISGLSIATIVIEAPERSGALITAGFALEQNREVFTIPGDIDRQNSLGPLNLLKKSEAHPISCGQDIIEILNKQPHLFTLNESPATGATKTYAAKSKREKIPLQTLYKLTPSQHSLLSLIPTRLGSSLEQLQKKSSRPPEEILANLSILEIQGIIEIKNGKYSRKC